MVFSGATEAHLLAKEIGKFIICLFVLSFWVNSCNDGSWVNRESGGRRHP